MLTFFIVYFENLIYKLCHIGNRLLPKYIKMYYISFNSDTFTYTILQHVQISQAMTVHFNTHTHACMCVYVLKYVNNSNLKHLKA